MSDAESATAPEPGGAANFGGAPKSSGAPAPGGTPRAWLGWNFAIAVLLSAFLLFQVQPLIGKFILPWFGGSPAVWTTCMLFFQVMLFGGYAYAHFSQRMLSPRLQGIVHAALLIVAVLLLPIVPDVGWKPIDSEHPTTRILALLAVCVGVPYFALSATGPLLQAWFFRACPGRSPYRLYALSNLGSLAALLTYPVLVEPALDLIQQAWMWSAAFAAFAILCGAAAYAAGRSATTLAAFGSAEAGESAGAGEFVEPGEVGGLLPAASITSAPEIAPTGMRRAKWLLLPACASLLLLATTNHICEDVPPMPFLWVVPLSLYLLTFIISFDHERWYQPVVFAPLAALAMLGAAGLLAAVLQAHFQIKLHYVGELSLFFSAMFLACMVCHGELVRSRPSPKYLTEFYLLISAGGALGGIFVSLVAPQIFRTFFEWKMAIIISYVVAVVVAASTFAKLCARELNFSVRRARYFLLGFGLIGLWPIAYWQILPLYEDVPLAQLRNFYGALTVDNRILDADETAAFYAADAAARADNESPAWPPAHTLSDEDFPELSYRRLRNGRVVHGLQFLDPGLSKRPTTYYAPASGLGQAILHFQGRADLRVGAVGLGVGTIAAARPGSYFRFYEINPQVLRVAKEYFTYLSNCQGKHDVVLGDARLSLEHEEPQRFHVLVLDAFSGDSIPTHLLTREAVETYLKHLAPDGVLAVHISNEFMDLAPVLAALAKHFQLGSTEIDSGDDEERLVFNSDWVLLTRNQPFLDAHPSDAPEDEHPRSVRMWTDHYSNLLEILK